MTVQDGQVRTSVPPAARHSGGGRRCARRGRGAGAGAGHVSGVREQRGRRPRQPVSAMRRSMVHLRWLPLRGRTAGGPTVQPVSRPLPSCPRRGAACIGSIDCDCPWSGLGSVGAASGRPIVRRVRAGDAGAVIPTKPRLSTAFVADAPRHPPGTRETQTTAACDTLSGMNPRSGDRRSCGPLEPAARRRRCLLQILSRKHEPILSAGVLNDAGCDSNHH